MIPDSFLKRLGHLFVGATDATGPGGSKAYLGDANEHGDGDDDYPPSNLQQQYPIPNMQMESLTWFQDVQFGITWNWRNSFP
jgi:hypothetical protein